MKYKGYTAVVELDEDQEVLVGHVVGLRDVITFQAETVSEAIKEFHASVDSYLAFCKHRKESPEKPYSGKFSVRLPPELHHQIVTRAQEEKPSLNAFVEHALRDKLHLVEEDVLQQMRHKLTGSARKPRAQKKSETPDNRDSSRRKDPNRK